METPVNQSKNLAKKSKGRGDITPLKPFQWKKGVSGNPKGRKPGKSLKTFAREYLESLPDNEKVEYLASLPMELVWRMAEGNPKNESDVKSDGKPIPILNVISKDVILDNNSNSKDSEIKEEN